MEKMAYKYDEQAEKNNSIIVNGVDVESVPADLGVEFLFQHFDGIFRINSNLKKKITRYLNYLCFISQVN